MTHPKEYMREKQLRYAKEHREAQKKSKELRAKRRMSFNVAPEDLNRIIKECCKK